MLGEYRRIMGLFYIKGLDMILRVKFELNFEVVEESDLEDE